MTTAEKVIKTKVGLLELGTQLGNVSKACRVMATAEIVFKGTVRDRGRSRTAGDITQQTESKESDR